MTIEWVCHRDFSIATFDIFDNQKACVFVGIIINPIWIDVQRKIYG